MKLKELKIWCMEKEWYGSQKFLAVFLFCFTFILSLILANVPYMDDYTRMDNGLGQWEYEGRPLTTLLVALLNFNINPVYNIGPIPLIFGTLFFSYTVCYATSKMELKKNLVNILPFTLLACNPFFIQNLSYQFDSIGNMFSVGCILLAFFYKSTSQIKTYVIQLLLLIAVSAFYQPTSNMYIAFFIANMIFQFKKTNDKVIKSIVYHGSLYLLSCVIYYIGCKLLFKYVYTDIAFRSEMIDFNLKSLLFSYTYSFNEFLDMCISFTNEKMFWLSVVAFIMLFINIIYVLIKNYKNEEYSKKNIIILNLILAFSPVIFIMTLWGPFILLKELFFNPRDFPVVGVFFMIGAMSFYFVDKKGYLQATFIALILCAVCGFSFVYGSALKRDYEYKSYVYDSMAMKLEDHKEDIKDKKIHMYGRAATSSFVRLALVEHNFIYRLIYANNTNFFKAYSLGARNIPNIQGGFVLDNLDEWQMICDKKIKPLVANSNYDIFNFEDHVSIWFKRNPVFCDNYPLETDIYFSRKADVYESMKNN